MTVARDTKDRAVRGGPSAIDSLERAFHLLRDAPARAWLAHLAGTGPFVIGLLYFWSDMSRSAFAASRCAPASLAMALLFLWMKLFQALFAADLLARLRGDEPPPWRRRLLARVFAGQAILQPSGLFLIPLAFVVALPFGWVFAFYQNASVLAAQAEGPRALARDAWKNASLWPRANHAAILILSLLGVVSFVNIGLLFVLLPPLLKSLLGIETAFTLSHAAYLNTTFLAAAAAVTWIVLDPVVKAFHVVRCREGAALRTGEDIRASLRAFRAARVVGATGAVLCVVWLFAGAVLGEEPPLAPPPPPPAAPSAPAGQKPATLSSADLDRAIEDVIHRPEYAWRLPRGKGLAEQAVDDYPFLKTFGDVIDGVGSALRAALRWIGHVMDWVWHKLRGAPPPPHLPAPSLPASEIAIRVLAYAGLCTAVCVLAVWLLRRRRRVKPASAGDAVAEPVTPDLGSDDVSPDQLPPDRWAALADEVMKGGDPRRALRALYLACLARLAERELIVPAKFKSNREYEREVERRAGTSPALCVSFRENVRAIDRAWYGMHVPTPDAVRRFRANYERITADAAL